MEIIHHLFLVLAMKINIEIIKKAIIHDSMKIENLNEKELVKKMMIRRRLTRSSKIFINLANACDFKNGNIVYGSAYGELIDTTHILESINTNQAVSPTSFQNSVYNTAASYHSIINNNTSEILTLSCGDETSYNIMQQAGLHLIREKEVFICVIEALNFNGIDNFNKCGVELEYGIAFTLKRSNKEANIKINNIIQDGVPSSINWMKNLYDACESKDSCIIEVEL